MTEASEILGPLGRTIVYWHNVIRFALNHSVIREAPPEVLDQIAETIAFVIVADMTFDDPVEGYPQ